MMNTREKRIGIVAGVLLGVLALDSVFLSPLIQRRSDAVARINDATRELATATRIFENDRRARHVWSEMAGQTLHDNASAAESQVLNAARRWAQEAGLTLTSLKPERSESEGGFRKITIRATATGSMRRVAQFLYAIQTAEMPIRISDIQLDARSESNDELSVQIGLATIYQPPADNGTATAGAVQ